MTNKEQKLSVYGDGPGERISKRHTLSVLVDNEPGVLSRIIGLFAGRGYNIDSLTVAEVSKALNQSRITVVVTGTPEVIEQVINLLARLVPVHKVTDLTEEGPHVERELVLIKVAGGKDKMAEALKISKKYNAEILDETPESYIFQVVANTKNMDLFLEEVIPTGMQNISRTGAVALSRGKEKF
jgi:acetolactate synthase-1/3 small subunit